MAQTICVALRKGGSGKTTTSVNLAAGLQLRGHKTLLIDLDDQANATMCAGINPFALLHSISTVFTDLRVQPQECVVETEYGLHVLPATSELEKVAAGMTATSIGELKPIVEALSPFYDYIIIDTQPGHDYLSLSALVAAQHVLIPLQAHYLAMEGVARIITDIAKIKNGLNPELSVLGIVPCMIQKTTISRAVLQKTREDYPGLVLPLEVKLSVRFINSSLSGSPLVISEPNHPGALEYMKLVDLIRTKLEGSHGKKIHFG